MVLYDVLLPLPLMTLQSQLPPCETLGNLLEDYDSMFAEGLETSGKGHPQKIFVVDSGDSLEDIASLIGVGLTGLDVISVPSNFDFGKLLPFSDGASKSESTKPKSKIGVNAMSCIEVLAVNAMSCMKVLAVLSLLAILVIFIVILLLAIMYSIPDEVVYVR